MIQLQVAGSFTVHGHNNALKMFEGKDLLRHIRNASEERKSNPIPFFILTLHAFFQERGKEYLIADFSRQVSEAPWSAEDSIHCLESIINDPPTNLKELIEEEAWVEIYGEDGSPLSFVCDLHWLGIILTIFQEIYDSPPLNDEAILKIKNLFMKEMDQFCKWN